MRRSKKQDDHHIRAVSRGGGRKRNIVRFPRDFHEHWHRIFDTLTVEEAHAFVDAIMQQGTSWSHEDLDALRANLMRQTKARKCA